ncbi:hypothetical protein NLJ89_g10604 [Agrocybe chaxingu]|uniref:Uncharacterized protein n=1 Tax=Agrocybe chaxingu TaxID=84603 RepID=A0A9W8JRG8_9AGAR|nr:hypothetical protein NLJ89_g10604 [Agrocybe chaxingu]
MYKRLWATQRHPYLAFVLELSFVGPVMSRFDPLSNHAKIVPEHGRWKLQQKSIDYWKGVEIAMMKASKALSDCILSKATYLRDLWDEPRKPSFYGYSASRTEPDKARRAVERSAYAFSIHASYISFLIALFRIVVPYSRDISIKDIYKRVALHSYLPMLESMFFSGIGDTGATFCCRRLVVSAQGCLWINLVPWFVESRVPVWIHWGKEPFLRVSSESWLSQYRPVPMQVHTQPVGWELCPAAASSSQPKPTERMDLESISSHVDPTFPPVQPHSGQNPGETMIAYFQRRKKKNLELMKTEGPAQRDARLKVVAEKERRSRPSKKERKFFYWAEHSGHRIRTYMPRKEAADMWDVYERIYDPWRDSWDLCSDFEEEVEVVGQIIRPREQSPLFDNEDKIIPAEDNAPVSHMGPLSPPKIDMAECAIVALPMLPASCASVPSSSTPPASNAMLPHPKPLAAEPRVTAVHLTAPPLGHSSAPSALCPPILETGLVLGRPVNAPTFHSVSPISPDPVDHSWSFLYLPMPSVDPMSTNAHSCHAGPAVQGHDHPRSPLSAPEPLIGSQELLPGPSAYVEDPSVFITAPPQPSSPDRMPSLETITAKEFMYYKYGCTSPMSMTSLLPPHFGQQLSENKKLDVTFQLVSAQHLIRDKGDDVALFDFLATAYYCKDRKENPAAGIPPMLWDLLPQNYLALHSIQSSFCIQLFETSSKTTLCILRPKSREGEAKGAWLVAVSPRIALECIRRGLGPTSVDIAGHLLSDSMPFNTLAPAPSLDPAEALRCKASAPRILNKSSNTSSCYDKYVEKRDSHLRSIGRGHRALSMGGIICRIAMECLADSAVLLGPSQEALEGNGAMTGYEFGWPWILRIYV